MSKSFWWIRVLNFSSKSHGSNMFDDSNLPVLEIIDAAIITCTFMSSVTITVIFLCFAIRAQRAVLRIFVIRKSQYGDNWRFPYLETLCTVTCCTCGLLMKLYLPFALFFSLGYVGILIFSRFSALSGVFYVKHFMFCPFNLVFMSSCFFHIISNIYFDFFHHFMSGI